MDLSAKGGEIVWILYSPGFVISPSRFEAPWTKAFPQIARGRPKFWKLLQVIAYRNRIIEPTNSFYKSKRSLQIQESSLNPEKIFFKSHKKWSSTGASNQPVPEVSLSRNEN